MPIPRPAAIFSMIVFLCAATASVVTLVWRGSFPDVLPASAVNNVLAEARGWSVATLLVALPLAIVSLGAAARGSLRGRLFWLGSLAYFTYTYLEFAVSPPFTALYLLYVTAFACAVPALVMGVASIDLAALPQALGDRPPRRALAVFSLVLAALLALAWLRGIVSRSVAGNFGWPLGAEAVGHVVHSLDLGLQVPLGLAAGILLLRRRPAGDLVAAIFIVNAVCMGAALTGMVGWAAAASGESLFRATPFAIVWAIAVSLAAAFFRTGQHAPPKNDSPRAPRGRLAAAAIGLEILLGVGALGGGLALMWGPRGEILPLPVTALSGSPFADYFVPGAILFVIIGLGPLVAAVLTWRRHRVTPLLTCAVGTALLVWLVVEIAVVGYSNHPPLQALYLGLGAVITLIGVAMMRQTGYRWLRPAEDPRGEIRRPGGATGVG